MRHCVIKHNASSKVEELLGCATYKEKKMFKTVISIINRDLGNGAWLTADEFEVAAHQDLILARHLDLIEQLTVLDNPAICWESVEYEGQVAADKTFREYMLEDEQQMNPYWELIEDITPQPRKK